MRGECTEMMLTVSKLKGAFLERILSWRASSSALRVLSFASSFSCFARFFAVSLSLGEVGVVRKGVSALSERPWDRRSIGRDCLYRPAMVDKDGSFLNWVLHDARMESNFFLTLVSAVGSEARCFMASTSWSSMQAAVGRRVSVRPCEVVVDVLWNLWSPFSSRALRI